MSFRISSPLTRSTSHRLSYPLSGGAATTFGVITAQTRSFNITGVSANLAFSGGFTLPAAVGAFTITGVAATLTSTGYTPSLDFSDARNSQYAAVA